MEWDRREDGDLQLAIVRGFEIAVADSEALAVRIEFAEVQEQLSGAMPQSSKQLDACDGRGIGLNVAGASTDGAPRAAGVTNDKVRR